MTRKRVVLLARAGAACERTQASIAEAGAELIVTLDPVSASEADIRAATPDAVMVILDPVVEQALENFDAVLGDPAFDVMFEDADVAAKREGWEAARWARHLNAKLNRHSDVLPPVKDGSAVVQSSEPSAKPTLSLEPRANVGRPIDSVFQQEMDALQRRVAAMPELPRGNQDAAPAKQGAVVIAAGVGGPDAVRQLLGMFPSGFPRPIVLRQRIEGGQYDKLVRQMQRATELRVVLAQAGDPLQPGTVHVLPEDLDVQAVPTGFVLAAVVGEPTFAALLLTDSAMLLLSGADLSLVDTAMALSWGGGLALGQSPENCFDPAASNALVARGGQAASLAQLPVKLLERWPV
ncbi:MAG: chemotaxis protein CheB [Thermomonas sp.]